MLELQVLIVVHSGEVNAILRVLGQLKLLDECIELRSNQISHLLALKILDYLYDEGKEEIFEEKLTRIPWVLKSILLGILSQLLIIVNKGSLVVNLQNGIDNVVQLLDLTTESSQEVLALLVTAMDLHEFIVHNRGDDLTLVDEKSTNLVSHLGLRLFLSSGFSSDFTFSSTLLLAHASVSFVQLSLLDLFGSGLECLSVLAHAFQDAFFNQLFRNLNSIFLVTDEALFLIDQPWQHSFVNSHLKFWLEHAHTRKSRDSHVFDADEVLLGNDARHVLLVSVLTLRLSSFLLIGSALLFSIDARFSGFESLCFNQLSVSNFLVLLLLLFHSGQLLFFEHFHTSLFESL